jgi:uncharacterized protein
VDSLVVEFLVANKRNPLVPFELPRSTERRFPIASGEIGKGKKAKTRRCGSDSRSAHFIYQNIFIELQINFLMEDLHNRWHHRWFNPKVECKKSPIHGIGIFAIDSIKKGEIIGVIGGIIVPISEIKEYWKKIGGDFGAQLSDDFYIVPSTKEELEKTGVFNHSCNPNTGWAGDIRAIAIKDIKKGEEITMDYGMYSSILETFECNCKSINCRKIITKNDWKLKELQEKYGKYFAPYLKEKINSLSS